MAANFHPMVCSEHRVALRSRTACFCLTALLALCPAALTKTRAASNVSNVSNVSNASSVSKAPALPPASVLSGKDGWLFLPAELRFLQFPVFWGENARTASRSSNPETADPLKAIAHFRDQLQAEGIRLVVVPVPPKALALRAALPPDTAAGMHPEALPGFLAQLRALGVETVDLLPVLSPAGEAPAEPLYCKTDSHWSGTGCEAAAKAIAEVLRPALDALPKATFRHTRTAARFHGDLEELRSPKAPSEETLSVRQISSAEGAALQPDPASPLLLLGDSHTLVFHDFLAERAGLLDQLAFETGVVPDLIGTRGSGANAVRVSLLRRSVKDPAYLTSKKVVVWCFAARELTESDQGWQNLPLKK